MSGKEACGIAYKNIKGRRKTGHLLFFILFLALFLYFVINSIALSVNQAVRLTKEVPIARNLIFQDKDGTLYTRLKEVCEDMEHVSEVYPYISEISVDAEGIRNDERVELAVKSCSDNYQDYLVKGRLPKENEILLPHYIYGMENGGYLDGSQYIGEILTLFVTDCLEQEREISYTVSGTYDNVYAVTGNNMAFLQPKDAVELYELQKEGIEKVLEELKASPEYDENIQYVGYEKQYFYAVVLDKRENLEVVGREISQVLDVGGSPEAHFVEGGAEAVLSFIQMIGTGLTVILLIVVIIMLGIMIGNDIRGRKKEMAMYLVQGYTKRNLLHILSMEYAIRLFPVLVSSVIVTIVTLILANVGIEKILSMEYRVIHMGFSVNSFFAGIGILAIVFCIAVYTISEQLKKINVLKEIKSEG